MNHDFPKLPLKKAPDEIWRAIEAELDSPAAAKRQRLAWLTPRWAVATAAAFALSIGAGWYYVHTPKAGWDVTRTDGSHGKIGVGEWLQTGAAGGATLTVGDIGTVEVEPNSRVRLVSARPGEQRMKLARGEISAVVSAPPRLFFVDTAASTAVDLGCAYTMKTDEDGNGLLRVTLGWVSLEGPSLEGPGRESMVPAGASCRTRPKTGPGTPYFEDASAAFQDALESFDRGAPDPTALAQILNQARPHDTLTLWHLISRVAPADRRQVFDRIVELVPLPAEVSAEKILRLDPDALTAWRESLALHW